MKILRFFKYLFYAAFSLCLLALIFIQTDYAKQYASDCIKKFCYEKTGNTIEFNDISLFPPFSFSASEVKVFDKDHQLLKVDALKLQISPFDLKEGDLLIHSLELQGVEIADLAQNQQESASLTWRDIPMSVEIESLKIHDLKTAYKGLDTHNDPISIEGSLYVQPSLEHINLHSRSWTSSKPREILQANLEWIHDGGNFRINLSSAASLEGHFKKEEDQSIVLSNLKGKAGPLSVEGNLHIDNNWNILKSSIGVSSLELSGASPFQGSFSGEIHLKGQLLKPQIDAAFSSDKILWGDHAFEDISIYVATQKRMSLQFIKEGRPYRFVSHLEWEIPLSPKAVATVEIADILQLFRIENSNINGQITCDIDLSHETTFGNIAIKNLSYESYALGCSFKNIEAIVALNKDKMIVSQLKGNDNRNGRFTGNGELALQMDEKFPFKFYLNFENTEIFNLDFFKAAATGTGIFHGNGDGAILEGDIVTDSMEFTIPEKSQAVKKTVEITYINQPSEEMPPTIYVKNGQNWPLKLNVHVKTGADATVRGKGLQSLWKGNVVVTGTSNNFLVNGELHLKEGNYQFRGKKLNLKSGAVNFQGNIEKNTTLYVIAEMALDKIIAEIIVKGSTTNPAITLRSTPPMSQREILSWILFNKGYSDISEFQGTQLNESITDLVNAADTGPDLLTRLQNSLGLDRIEFSGNKDNSGMSIQVGKYISKKTFLTLSHKTGGNSDTNSTGETHSLGIETTLKKNIKFQAEMDDGGNGQANILWKRDY